MPARIAPVVFRLVFAVLAIGGVAFQLFAIHIPRGYSVVNYFTYFTNLSNLIIGTVFIVSAVRLLRAESPSQRDTALRGAAVVYIAFVGIVFNTLLTGADLSGINPAVNVILHMVLPIVAMLDWILWPPRNRLPFSVVWWWMIFPAVYAIFSVVRGAFDGVYPYPFFNPDTAGGYGGVLLYCLGMVAAFFVLAVIIRWIGNLRGRRNFA